MNRRKFFALAGGMTGYSVMVKVDHLAAATLMTPAHQEITKAFDTIAPAGPENRHFAPEPNMRLVELTCDVFVAGGGMAGSCAAISAARNGAKGVLCQARSRLGGTRRSQVQNDLGWAAALGA